MCPQHLSSSSSRFSLAFFTPSKLISFGAAIGCSFGSRMYDTFGVVSKKERLLKIFEGWCDYVLDLIIACDEDAILRRDIYDLTPTCTWERGHVTLLGDSVHAMQPNMSQGGCMAIEDSYQLAEELDKAWRQSVESGTPVDIVSSLRSYERNRRLRVAIIHAMARMAAMLVSNYKSYLDIGFGPLLVGTVVDYMKWRQCF
ncbi:hypothetical protein SLEP1_g6532 [Rubroshorea leprosula]|uniref:FAD-binding domain-containing protein n=1 Tax=Rubroshorea leprosula TaxID=152421 RepID=A0AAV5I5B6_9ROSI|nr:hypothetical protein SLEP1_g6532 [Rubroshorea leprosula]